MNDRYDPNLILDYIEGEIDALRRARLETMLAEDESLRELVEQLQADRDAVRALPQEHPASDLTEPAMGLLERRLLMGEEPVIAKVGPNAMSVPRRSVLGRVWVGASLAAVLALAGGVVWLTTQDGPLMKRAERLAKTSTRSNETRVFAQAEQAGKDEESAAQPKAVSPADTAAADRSVEALSAAVSPATAIPAAANKPLSIASRSDTFSEGLSRPVADPLFRVGAQAPAEPTAVVIRTNTPVLTRQQVQHWAVSNALPMSDAPPASEPRDVNRFFFADAGSQTTASVFADEDADAAVSDHEVTYVLATPEQITLLLNEINQVPLRQNAVLANSDESTLIYPSRQALLRERRLGDLYQVATMHAAAPTPRQQETGKLNQPTQSLADRFTSGELFKSAPVLSQLAEEPALLNVPRWLPICIVVEEPIKLPDSVEPASAE